MTTYQPRLCDCGCGRVFTPSHGAQKFDRVCAKRRQTESWQRRRANGYKPPKEKQQPPKLGKPFIGATAPDFRRALPELLLEFARVDCHQFDRNAPVRRPTT